MNEVASYPGHVVPPTKWPGYEAMNEVAVFFSLEGTYLRIHPHSQAFPASSGRRGNKYSILQVFNKLEVGKAWKRV